MARVKAPLFSLGASGQIGRAIVYATWKGRDYAREYQVPANPDTVLQQNVRKAWDLLVISWQAASTPVHDAWNLFAEQFQMSGFNQYIGRGMKEYVAQLTTAVAPSSVGVTGDPPADVWVWA